MTDWNDVDHIQNFLLFGLKTEKWKEEKSSFRDFFYNCVNLSVGVRAPWTATNDSVAIHSANFGGSES